MAALVEVCLEVGAKRTFAAAIAWPGWCRPGRDEAAALAALLAHGPKYAKVLVGTRLGFVAPKALDRLRVVERLRGTSATDFGAPSVVPAVDRDRTCDAADRQRLTAILRAGWRAFDAAVASAAGKRLATGPRGGGRSLEAIVEHVLEADRGYLSAVGWKAPAAGSASGRLAATREAIAAALEASATGMIPAEGPRGGQRWTARWFARRVAWHTIAHAWEIERRAAG